MHISKHLNRVWLALGVVRAKDIFFLKCVLKSFIDEGNGLFLASICSQFLREKCFIFDLYVLIFYSKTYIQYKSYDIIEVTPCHSFCIDSNIIYGGLKKYTIYHLIVTQLRRIKCDDNFDSGFRYLLY